MAAYARVMLLLVALRMSDGIQVMNCTLEKYFGRIVVADNSLCGFKQSTSDNFNWSPGNGPTMTKDTGPSEDHTGVLSGYFLYIESSYKSNGSRARLDSPVYTVPAADRGGCVQLYYHMYGADIGSLKVMVYSNSQYLNAWNQSGNQGNTWLRADVEMYLTPGASFQVIIEATTTGPFKDSKGDIAIDDIVIETNGACSQNSETVSPTVSTASTPAATSPRPMWSCNFDQSGDSSWCGIVRSNRGGASWAIATRSFRSTTGPQSDVSAKGSFASMQGIAYAPNSTASMETPIQSGFSCLSFQYHMYGRTVAQLSVLADVGGQYQLLWSQSGNQGNQWVQTFVPLAAGTNRLRFDALRGADADSDIAVDEIFLNQTTCDGSTYTVTSTTPTLPPTTRSQPPLAFACSFDYNFCNLYQDKSDNFDFNRLNTPSWSAGTGPQSDHTRGDLAGYYAYTEASYKSNGSVARLSTGLLDVTPGRGCLRFFFHMWGSQIGILNVRVRAQDGSTVAVWSKSGDQGNQWRQADVPITYQSSPVYIEFEGIIIHNGTWLTDVKGDIALDDIMLTKTNPCTDLDMIRIEEQVTAPTTTLSTTLSQITKQSTATPPPTTTLPRITTPTTTPPITTPSPVFACNFDTSDLCGYTQDIDDFDWSRLNTRTWSENTGPAYDHTSGNGTGYFVYIEATYKRNGTKARLLSPQLSKLENSGCLRFYYHMWGRDIGTLNVYIRASGNDILLFSRTGDQGNRWQLAMSGLDLRNTDTFQIIFEGTISHDLGSLKEVLGDIALDDVSVDRQSLCQGLPATTSPITLVPQSSLTTPKALSSPVTLPTSKTTKNITPRASIASSKAPRATVAVLPGQTGKLSGAGGSSDTGMIAGVVIGVMVALAVVAVLGVLFLRRRQLWLFSAGSKLSVAFSRKDASDTSGLYDTADATENPIYHQSSTLKINGYE